jgi:hypothetical protein
MNEFKKITRPVSLEYNSKYIDDCDLEWNVDDYDLLAHHHLYEVIDARSQLQRVSRCVLNHQERNESLKAVRVVLSAAKKVLGSDTVLIISRTFFQTREPHLVYLNFAQMEHTLGLSRSRKGVLARQFHTVIGTARRENSPKPIELVQSLCAVVDQVVGLRTNSVTKLLEDTLRLERVTRENFSIIK